MHEIDAHDEHRFDPRVRGDDSCGRGKACGKRSTGAADVKRAGILGAQLILQHDRGRGVM